MLMSYHSLIADVTKQTVMDVVLKAILKKCLDIGGDVQFQFLKKNCSIKGSISFRALKATLLLVYHLINTEMKPPPHLQTAIFIIEFY